MKAGTAQSGRTLLAVFAAIAMIMSLMAVYAMPADADHDNPDDTYTSSPGDGSNEADFWDDYFELPEGSCWKINEDGSTAFEMPSPPEGQEWYALVIKQGSAQSNDGPDNFIYLSPEAGHSYPSTGDQAPGYSHVIVCSVDEPEPEETTFSIGGSCEVVDDEAVFTISGNLGDGLTLSVAGEEITDSGDFSINVDSAGDYDYTVDVDEGFVLADGAPPAEGTITIEDCTPPPPPPEVGEIVVQKVVTGEASQTFAFTFNTTGFILGDNTLAHGESSSSGDLEAGTYAVSEQPVTGWTQVSATCDDGSDPSNIDLAAGETVTCTFVNTIETEVQASIVVTVGGTCEVDGDEGVGIIDVEISVDGGADVVISDSDGDVIETFTSSGTVTVPEGATYTWEATPNEGFEFPAGSDTSGSITIETCSDDPETLPFTGIDTGMMSVLASALLGAGLLLVTAMRRQEEA